MEKPLNNGIESINELVERLRLGEIDGTIEITINNKGKINKILIKNKENSKSDSIKRINLEKPDLANVDLSRTNLSGSDFSGINLRNANLSYSSINNSDLSYTNLKGASLYKTALSQTSLANAQGVDASSAYFTGSVNLYNVNPPTERQLSNAYDTSNQIADRNDYGEHPINMGMVEPENRRKNY